MKSIMRTCSNKKMAAMKAMNASDSNDTEEEDSPSSGDNEETTRLQSQSVYQPLISQTSHKKNLPGALLAPPHVPRWYIKRILEEERPDLAEKNGKFNLELNEMYLLDKHLRERAELQIDDMIVVNDNRDDDDRDYVRYQIQLKYNEGRYSSIYIVSKQVCRGNNVSNNSDLYVLKTGNRNGSSTFTIKMKRELRILSIMTKARIPWAPRLFDSGTVCDMPFIVMNLLDMNIEKLREMIGGRFKLSSVFYIAGELLNALVELHNHGFVHRDVKPTNICVGVGPLSSRIFLIDYGDTVRIGKNISTPDSYTLPYWSLDCHRRSCATEMCDFEGWFYTIGDLLVPSILTWKSILSEKEVKVAKTVFWTDFPSRMTTAPPAFISIAETIHATNDQHKVDVERLKNQVKIGLDQCVKRMQKFTPEWVRPSVRQRAIATTRQTKSRNAN
ncbi:hypothetical protein DICVIV_13325 [Dictyocaulus viviparus]|uniref:non-specific serine/threonine protein kinase n=1 Tax=Dictyocaulus viviparus TaxID=29172 RepID=A0A0D8X846_DICVI|nr:hypothetical protein DICVIV_13325 [Dictyocaulus viviparus]